MSNGKIKYLMACGHVAQAVDGKTGKPGCVFCFPNPKSMIVKRTIENMTNGLEGRKARCAWCNKKTDSRWDLAFLNTNLTKNMTNIIVAAEVGIDG